MLDQAASTKLYMFLHQYLYKMKCLLRDLTYMIKDHDDRGILIQIIISKGKPRIIGVF